MEMRGNLKNAFRISSVAKDLPQNPREVIRNKILFKLRL